MTEQVNRVDVEIFGDYYTLKGSSTEEQMIALAQYVNRKMKQLTGRNIKLSKTQAAVLAALNIADEFKKLQEEHNNLVRMLEPEIKTDKKNS